MFTLDSPHYLSLILALSFALVVHFSFVGFFNKLDHFFISFTLFPFALMASTLFVPQFFLQMIAYLLVTCGFFSGMYKFPSRYRQIASKLDSMEKKEKWILIGTCIYLLSFFMSATIFKGGGDIQDALVYHLEGPKEWALYLNGAKFNPNNPITFTTSYYDYFYYFLFLLAKPLFAYTALLNTTHYEFISYTMLLSAQLFTAIVALVYVPILILKFASALPGLYKYLSVFFIFGLRLITWSWLLPKNDAFSFLCFLLAVDLFSQHYLFKKDNEKTFFLFLASLVLGIGTASKLTNAYVVIFSLLFLASFYFKEISIAVGKIGLMKAITIVAFGLGTGAFVFLLRNFLHTGNPFYPIAKFGFPNIYLSDYADRPELYSDPGTWPQALDKIKNHLWRQPQLLLLLFAAFFTRTRALSLFYLAMVVYMAKQTGPMFTFRMTTIFLVLALILFILVIRKLDSMTKFRTHKIASSLLIAIVLIFSKIQIEKIVKYPSAYYLQKTSEMAKNNVEFFEEVLKDNLKNKNNPRYVFSPKQEFFPFFSRYPFTSLYDSVPKYRYDYYEKPN